MLDTWYLTVRYGKGYTEGFLLFLPQVPNMRPGERNRHLQKLQWHAPQFSENYFLQTSASIILILNYRQVVTLQAPAFNSSWQHT